MLVVLTTSRKFWALMATDAWVRKPGWDWKHPRRLAYPFTTGAVLHFYVQAKLNVSEPVFVSGPFVWLMARRVLPRTWRRD